MGRRALVIGGTGGIGRALSLSLSRRGASLLLHGGSDAARLASILAECDEASGKAGYRTRHDGFLLAIDHPGPLLDRLPALGPIDLLAVSFGPFLQAALHRTGPADWERIALLDLALPGSLVSALLPGMMERGWGRIILFGGTGTDTIRAFSGNAAYAAAKTGIGVLVKSVAVTYASSGIAAFGLCPGLVDTEYLAPALREELRAKAPEGRLIGPRAVGELVAGLAAGDPCIASGALISLDGGLKL